ncbi:putative spore wall protein 30 [Vairimorpha necatrix]|uniref:Spore wall protein 30 n=1 Tax=Vairimorpha necatrix TaxID=6039 RepID=A0AAX4JB01_9MICR
MNKTNLLVYFGFLFASRYGFHSYEKKSKRSCNNFPYLDKPSRGLFDRSSSLRCPTSRVDDIECEDNLITFAALDSKLGCYSKSNLLRCNFYLLECILKSLCRSYNNTNHSIGLDRNDGRHCHELYIIFKRCLYYVDFCDYERYKNFLEKRLYVECFYVIYNNLKCERKLCEYIELLICAQKEYNINSCCFYNSKEKCIIDTSLKCCHESKFLSADFLLDPICILELNLYERTQLLNIVLHRYNRRNEARDEEIRCFLELYNVVYLRNKQLDHQVTAFVLYKLCSEFSLRNHNRSQIILMHNFLKEYKNGLHCREAYFFCLMTFGSCKK